MKIVLMGNLFVSNALLNFYIEKFLGKGHEFEMFPSSFDKDVQLKCFGDADILIMDNFPLSGDVIAKCKKLKFIDIAFTGYDSVDVATAKELGIAVSNASGYSTVSVAEQTICVILSLLRKIRTIESQGRDGISRTFDIGNQLCGKTVGIIGTGKIGMTTAKLCSAFGCKILGFSGFSTKQDDDMITYLPLKTLLEESDIVILHCKLTEQSFNLINEETLSYMKKTAILINSARGKIVDSVALAKALNNEEIAGAGIDVLDVEPPIPTSHPLLNSKNTLITPHMAYCTMESMQKRAEIVFDNLEKWLDGIQMNKIV